MYQEMFVFRYKHWRKSDMRGPISHPRFQSKSKQRKVYFSKNIFKSVFQIALNSHYPIRPHGATEYSQWSELKQPYRVQRLTTLVTCRVSRQPIIHKLRDEALE